MFYLSLLLGCYFIFNKNLETANYIRPELLWKNVQT